MEAELEVDVNADTDVVEDAFLISRSDNVLWSTCVIGGIAGMPVSPVDPAIAERTSLAMYAVVRVRKSTIYAGKERFTKKGRFSNLLPVSYVGWTSRQIDFVRTTFCLPFHAMFTVKRKNPGKRKKKDLSPLLCSW